MRKIFVCSDIHGYYTILINALREKGFERENPDHVLMLLGDAFDRGSEAVLLLSFLLELKKAGRLIFIKGNHTLLMLDCLKKIKEYKKPQGLHHYSNGTIGTICQLTNDINITYKLLRWDELTNSEIAKINAAMKPWKNLIKDALNYYETEKYVFVHGWIPVKTIREETYFHNEEIAYIPDWRDLPEDSPLWDKATWVGYPLAQENNCYEPGKIIVCGHWHSSDYNSIKDGTEPFPPRSSTDSDWKHVFRPAVDEHFIAIDACTAYSGLINILVFEEKTKKCVEILDI